jgi:hypothetical protein
MRNLFLIGLFSIALFACDDRLEGFLSSEGITVVFNNGVAKDSVKLGLKSGADYSLEIQVANPEVVANNTVSAVLGDAIFLQDGQLVESLNIKREMNIAVRPQSIEPLRVRLEVGDAVGNISTFDLDLVVFQNLTPIANHSISEVIRTDAIKEYTFNGSLSKDPDQKFGGGIQVYKWLINGVEYLRTEPTLTLTFTSAQSFTGNFSVVDSDGASSNQVNF